MTDELDRRSRLFLQDLAGADFPPASSVRRLAVRRRRSKVVAGIVVMAAAAGGLGFVATSGHHHQAVQVVAPPTTTAPAHPRDHRHLAPHSTTTVTVPARTSSTTAPAASPSTTLAPTTTTSPPTTAPTTTAVSCPQASTDHDQDGTIEPLFCSNGTDDPSALAYYEQARFDPEMLKLPSSATRSQVIAAMCSDLRTTMSVQTEQEAYELAANRAGWTYDIMVVDVDGGCPAG